MKTPGPLSPSAAGESPLERERQQDLQKMRAAIQPGDIFHGKVIKLVVFGAFVERDGLVGLLPLSEMSSGRLDHPSEVLAEGQTVECIVLQVDREKCRVTLGLKERLVSPWDTVHVRYPVGTRIRGKVAYVAPYGAFVELERCLEGLLHISEMSSTRRVANASEVFSKGQVVEAIVLSINVEERKISLGRRQLEEKHHA